MKGYYKNKYRIASARHPNWDYGGDSAYFITICTQHRTHFFGEINEGIMQLSPIGVYAQQCWDEIPNHFPFVQLGAFVVMPNHIHGIIIIDKNENGGDIGDDKTHNNDDYDYAGNNNDHPVHPVHPVETQNFASLPPNNPSSSSQPTSSLSQPTPPTHNPSSSSQPTSPPQPTPPTHNPSSASQPTSPPNDPSSSQPTSPIQPPSSPTNNPPSQPQPQKNKFGPQSKNLASIVRGYKIGVTKSAKKIDPNWQWQSRYHDHIIRNRESFKRITTYIINNPTNWKEDRFYLK